MDKSIIALILNCVLIAFIILGFLFGLKGLKKSGMSLAFFIVSLIVTTIITPFVTSAVLKIQFNINGAATSVHDYLLNMIKDNALIKELASNGSNLEAFINNFPQMVGNLVVFMLLVILVGILFKIAYAITGIFVFKKERELKKRLKQNKKAKNPVTKHTPANVSATGNVTYIREETLPKKRRLLGGLVGAVHALAFLVAFMLPVFGTLNTYNSFMYEVEQPTTASITLELQNDLEPAPEQQTNGINYTPFARLIQEYVPAEVLGYLDVANKSILSGIVKIANPGDVWYNNIAMCKVNGKKIVLKKEINSVVNVYNNVEYLTKLDFSTIEGIKQIDFVKIRKAVNSLFESNLLVSVTPELTNKYLDWATRTDISDLAPELKNVVEPIRELMAQNQNISDFVLKLKDMMSTNQKQMDLLKNELKVILNLGEIFVNSKMLDYVMAQEGVSLNDVILELVAEDHKLSNKIIDNVFSSEYVNLGSLVGTNYLVDILQKYFDETLLEDSVQIGKINVFTTTNKFDGTMFKNIINTAMDMYLEYDEIGFKEISKDFSKVVTDDFDSNLAKLGEILDNIKNMAVLNEFGTRNAIIDNLSKLELNVEEGSAFTKITDLINLPVIKQEGYSFKTELMHLTPAIKSLINSNVTINEEDKTLIYAFMENDLNDVIKSLSNEQVDNIIRPLAQSQLLQPLYNYAINTINNTIVETLGGEIQDILPEGIDLSEQTEEIVAIIIDAKDLLPVIEDITSGEKDLEEIILDQATENKETIISFLENLQENANNEGVFTDVYNTMVDYISDETNGLTGVAELIEEYTNPETNLVDWASLVEKYIQDNQAE